MIKKGLRQQLLIITKTEVGINPPLFDFMQNLALD